MFSKMKPTSLVLMPWHLIGGTTDWALVRGNCLNIVSYPCNSGSRAATGKGLPQFRKRNGYTERQRIYRLGASTNGWLALMSGASGMSTVTFTSHTMLM